MNIKIRISNVLGIIFYRMILDVSYVYIISHFYASTGLVNDENRNKYIISWVILLVLLPIITSNYRRRSLSANIVILFSLVSFVPITSLIAFIPSSNKFILLTFIYWAILLLFNYFMPKIKLILPNRRKTNYFFYFILFILSLTVVYISGVYTHFRLHFGIFDVYKLRMEEREFNLPLLLTYLHTAANTILPVILVYFLYNKRRVLVLLFSFIIMLNFGIGGHKSVLLIFILSFLGYWFYKFNRISYISWVLVFFCLLGIGEFYFYQTYLISIILPYRALFLPAQIHYYYYDFFSTHELDYFRQGILRWFDFTSPYKQNIDFIIGDIYFNNAAVRANNGLFSDAYKNMGVLGVIIFPFIIVIILRFLDACAKGLDEKFVFLPILVTTMALISISFSTALLTSGLLIMMITLYFLPRKFNSI